VAASATSTFNNVQLADNLTINPGVTVELIEDSKLTIDKGGKLVIAVDTPSNFKAASGDASVIVTSRTDAELEVDYRQTSGTDTVVVAINTTATLPSTGDFDNSETGVTVTLHP
jgi:NAD(P)H-hydrate repair Nnr-like enzyme with NAD(P)H-hydrate epimerase domain